MAATFVSVDCGRLSGPSLPIHLCDEGIPMPLARRASCYSANHMISGKLVDCVDGGGAWVGCVVTGALVETVEPSTVN